jgi:hypothetical protein
LQLGLFELAPLIISKLSKNAFSFKNKKSNTPLMTLFMIHYAIPENKIIDIVPLLRIMYDYIDLDLLIDETPILHKKHDRNSMFQDFGNFNNFEVDKLREILKEIWETDAAFGWYNEDDDMLGQDVDEVEEEGAKVDDMDKMKLSITWKSMVSVN